MPAQANDYCLANMLSGWQRLSSPAQTSQTAHSGANKIILYEFYEW